MISERLSSYWLRRKHGARVSGKCRRQGALPDIPRHSRPTTGATEALRPPDPPITRPARPYPSQMVALCGVWLTTIYLSMKRVPA